MKKQTYKNILNLWENVRKILKEQGYKIKSGAVDYKNFQINAIKED